MKKLFIALTVAIALFTGHTHGMNTVSVVEPRNIRTISVSPTEQQEKIICACRSRLGAIFVICKLNKNGSQITTIANCEPNEVEDTSAYLSNKLIRDLSKEPIDSYRTYRFCQSSTQLFEGTPRNKIGTIEIRLTPGHVEPTFLVSKDFYLERV